MRQNPSVGVAACKLTRQESSGLSHSARSQWEKLPTRGACRKREAPAQDYSKHISSSIYLDTRSKRAVTKAGVDAALAQFINATGTTFWVVVAISK